MMYQVPVLLGHACSANTCGIEDEVLRCLPGVRAAICDLIGRFRHFGSKRAFIGMHTAPIENSVDDARPIYHAKAVIQSMF